MNFSIPFILAAFMPLFSLSLSGANPESISTADRLRGMIWGQLVADAAALGAHWIYDPAKMAERFPNGVEPFATPAEGHYHEGKHSGAFTLYGDAGMLVLETVAEEGHFDHVAFGERFMSTMTPGHYRGYIDHATTQTWDHYQAWKSSGRREPFDYQQGADDNQMASATSVAAVVAAHYNDSDFLSTIETFVKVRQDHPEAIVFVQFQALVLKELLHGASFESAVEAAITDLPESPEKALVIERFADAAKLSGTPSEATAALGASCPLPDSIPASAYTLEAVSETYENAILATLQAGGENAGRACVVGAWYGAAHGIDAIPSAWREQLKNHAQVEELVEIIVKNAT